MSSGPGFVIADMNLPLKRVNVISLCAEDLAGTRSFYQEVPGLPLTFEDEAAAAFRLEKPDVCVSDVSADPELIWPTAVASTRAPKPPDLPQ